MTDNILILGANSDIAFSIAKKFAKEKKANFILASKDLELLEKKKKDLIARYNLEVETYFFDATNIQSHQNFYDSIKMKIDLCVLCFGYLGDQVKAQNDFDEAKKIIDLNFVGATSILEIIASDFEKNKKGTIIGISSVAGDKGRCKNYFYGAAKGAFSIYLSGLRNRLFKSNVSVITVKPGFVNTKMTKNLPLPKKLTAESDEVANDIFKAYKKKKDVIYSKKIWRLIMLIIRHIPEKIFKRTNI